MALRMAAVYAGIVGVTAGTGAAASLIQNYYVNYIGAPAKLKQLRALRGNIQLNDTQRFWLDSTILPVQIDPTVSIKGVAGVDPALKRRLSAVVACVHNATCGSQNYLFYGSPGTGKTLMASAMAREADIPVILVQRNTKSVWHGETEAREGALFTYARKIAPCIVFIDEIDRSNFSVQELLTNLDGFKLAGVNKPIIFIAASNHLDYIDRALRNRIPTTVKFIPPNATERLEILQRELKLANVDLAMDLQKHIASKALVGRQLHQLATGLALEMQLFPDEPKNQALVDNLLKTLPEDDGA